MVIPDSENIYLFIITAILILATPGPAIIYIMTKSIDQGYKAGVVSSFGIETGGLFHVFAAAFGISAILMLSSTAFIIVKYIGAIYLIFLGIMKFTSKIEEPQKALKSKRNTLNKIFFEGIIVNLFNPKTALFFLTFLPQFINIEKGHTSSQIIFLGLLFIFFGILVNLVYVVVSGKLRDIVKNSISFQKLNKYIVGSIYISLGVLTMFSNNPTQTNSNTALSNQ